MNGLARITLYVFPELFVEKMRWAEEVAKSSRRLTIPVADPIILFRILEKAPRHDVEIFVVKEGRVYRLSEEQVEKIFEYGDDVFLNLDNCIAAHSA